MAARRILLLSLVPASAIAFACSETSSSEPTTTPDGGASTTDAGTDTATPASDSGSETKKTTCEITSAWLEGCGHDKNCGDKYDAWCKANDDAINSDTYRRAEAKCLTQENCTAEKRNDCEYKHYNTETPSAAQKAVIAAYCSTCEPGDSSCATRATKYDPTLGPKSVTDVFIAAWELGDPLCDSIRTKCTGANADAGSSIADCRKAFGECAADVYLDKVPECPR